MPISCSPPAPWIGGGPDRLPTSLELVLPPSRSPRIGLFGGARAVFQGVGWIVATPATWRYAIVPVLVALGLLGGSGALAIWGAVALTHAIVGAASGAAATAFSWLLEIVLGAVGLMVALVVAMSLAQPLSGFALDAISRTQDERLGGRSGASPGGAAGIVRSLGVTLTGLGIGLPLLLLLTLGSVLVPPAAVVTVPLKFVVTALMIAWDLLDYPLTARGMSVGARLKWMAAHFGAVLGFGLASGALLLIPGIGLLLLPGGVAGATRLVLEAEGRLSSSRTTD